MNISPTTPDFQQAISRGADARTAKTIAEAQSTATPTLKPGQTFLSHLNSLKIQLPVADQAATASTFSSFSKPNQSFSDRLNSSTIPTAPSDESDVLSTTLKPGQSSIDHLNSLKIHKVPSTDINSQSLAKAAPAQTQKPVAEPAQVQPISSPTLKPGQTYLERLNTFKIQKPLTEDDEKARVTKVAGDLVSNALILPIMKQIRRSVWAKDGLFTGGVGEKTFGPEFDMQIADRIAHSPRMAVTNSLAQRLSARAEKLKPATQPARNATPKTGVDLHG